MADRAREVFEAVMARDAVLLSEVLENISSNERTFVLAADQFYNHGWRVLRETPLIAAVLNEDLDCVKVLIKYKADVEGVGNYFDGEHILSCCTPLYCSADTGNLDILSCLIENGADINACTENNLTPLMTAIARGHLNVVTFLVKHGANLDVQNEFGKTALHLALCRCRCVTLLSDDTSSFSHYRLEHLNCCHAVMLASESGEVNLATFLIEHGASVTVKDRFGVTPLHYAVCHPQEHQVLSCLMKNGADVNARTEKDCTPLMMAAGCGRVDAVTFLIEHGANIDHQDKNGNTALHFALSTRDPEFVDKLLALGASHLSNNVGLTPLLQASTVNNHEMVEHLIQRPEITKEQRIDALELLGASCIVNSEELNDPVFFDYLDEPMQDSFKYMKQGMELRFTNPTQPLLKQPMEPVKAYGNRKESQTLEELAQVEGDLKAIIMESLIIRERILGKLNTELLKQIRPVAFYMSFFDPLRSMELYRHAVEIAQSSNQTASDDLRQICSFLRGNLQIHLKQRDVLKLLEQTVLEYEKQDRLRRGIDDDSELCPALCQALFDLSVQLLSFIPRFCEEGKIYVLALLRKLSRFKPRDDESKNTVLHEVITLYMNDSGIDIVKLLLNAGFNVNAVNNKGNTPIHLAVTFRPSNDKIHCLTDMLKVLLNGGAHHDFVNNDGKTPMDMAQTDEARVILSEGRNLELQCVSARAVKKFGIPYLGVVPKTVEKYISMH